MSAHVSGQPAGKPMKSRFAFRGAEQDAACPVGAASSLDGLVLGLGQADLHDDGSALLGWEWRSAGAWRHASSLAGHKKLVKMVDTVTYAGHNKTMTTTAQKYTVEKIEDREFDGRCGHCGREGLRWVVCLSDGHKMAEVGVECSKELLGYKIQPKTYTWMKDFRPVAEHRSCGALYVLYQHKTHANVSAWTQSGYLQCIGGGAERDWQRRVLPY